MKKNYLMPQIEVSEMMANAILADSGAVISGGNSNQPVSGGAIGGGSSSPINVGGGTVPSGTGGGAKVAPDHFSF